jgi:hypothetical protein
VRRLRFFLAGLLAAAALLSPAAQDEGRTAPRFRYERPVVSGGAGPNRLEPDVPLLAGAQPLAYAPGREAGSAGAFLGGLADLRLFDAAGREVPYLLVAPAQREPEWRHGSPLPLAATKTTSGFEVDLGASGAPGSAAPIDRVRIGGLPAPFLKRFRLEGGGDRSRWTVLVAEGTLFDLPDEHLRQLDVAIPAGGFRYLRLTWNDATSGRLPLPGEVAARRVRPVDPGPPARVPIAFERRPSEPGKSRFRLRLPAARLPVVALELDVPGGPGAPLLRAATVTQGHLAGSPGTPGTLGITTEITPVRLGEATLRRAVRDGLSAADLRIPLSASERPDGPDLELTVDDGDNPPLPLAGVTAELAPLPWIYFEAAGPAPLTARFGDPKSGTPPRYDLEALRDQMGDQVISAHAATARWGARRDLEPRQEDSLQPLPGLSAGAPLDRRPFRYRREIPAAPPGLTALLLDAAVLSRSAELADLRIADGAGRQVPYLLERRDEPLALPLPTLARHPGEGDPPSRSRYPVELPYPTLPAARLVLATPARVFERDVRLVEIREASGDRRSARPLGPGDGEPVERTVAQASWRHADPDAPAPELTLDLPAGLGTHLALLVEEGDNAPLPLAAPRLLLPATRLRFFTPATPATATAAAPGRLELLYGQPELGAPRYDLSLLAPRLLGEAAQEIALGAEPHREAEADPAALERKIFWGALIGAVLVLLLILARLLRGHPNPPV